MIVVGFTSYADFLEEVTLIRPEVIRLQDYYTTHHTNGLPRVRHRVQVGCVVSSGRVLVCNFTLGETWGGQAGKEDRIRLDHDARKAAGLIMCDLIGRGFDVRPGLIAQAQESKALADPSVWTYQGDPPELAAFTPIEGGIVYNLVGNLEGSPGEPGQG